MSKEVKTSVGPAADKAAGAPASEEVRLTLDGFCSRLSETVKRPELIGAFHFSEKQQGHVAGTASEFQARYDSYINKPV